MPMPQALVLLPGFMLDETLWDQVIQALPSHYTLHPFPLCGGDDIPAVVQRIRPQHPKRCVVVGFSLGGYVARQLAADCPESVAGLVLIATSLREQRHGTEHQWPTQQKLTKLSPRAIRAALHPQQGDCEALISAVHAMGERLGPTAWRYQSSLSRTGIASAILHCPSLVIGSRHDRIRSLAESEELAQQIPQSTLKVFEASGHLIPLEQPQVRAKTIVQWLDATAVTHDDGGNT